MTDLPKILTVTEVARVLRVSRAKAYALVRTEIPCLKMGRSVRMREADLLKWIAQTVQSSK